MTHVEVWAGDGPKTIGARWHRGKVQVFDSYRFEARSYHTPTYHLKSIDTWLKGICQRSVPPMCLRTARAIVCRSSRFTQNPQLRRHHSGK